jgi:hypothetical protein
LKLADAAAHEGSDVYNNLPKEEKAALSSELVRRGRDMSELAALKENGKFVHFLRPRGVLEVFKINPKLFFDGGVWEITYANIPALQPDGGERLQTQIRTQQGILLEIAAVYSEKGVEDPREAELAKAACNLIAAKILG